MSIRNTRLFLYQNSKSNLRIFFQEQPFQPEPAQDSAMSSKDNWEFYDDETYAMQEPIGSEPESDSDFEYEGGRSKRGKGKKGAGRSTSKGVRQHFV